MAEPLISTAVIGHEFGPYDVTIVGERATAYSAAVGGDESPDYGDTLAPIIIVAAALTELIDDLGLYSGGLQTVHAGQEVSWGRAVYIGEKVEARGKLAANSIRRGNHFATVTVSYTDGNGAEIGTSSTTIIVTGEQS
ncbi:MAG: MaoC family dehydratase N-terminal domain-containing protein [Chloroflexi bacterium]|nr:MaoC family dehydratase N-terminal domain-containing protein [Chloroflexota bacterium]